MIYAYCTFCTFFFGGGGIVGRGFALFVLLLYYVDQFFFGWGVEPPLRSILQSSQEPQKNYVLQIYPASRGWGIGRLSL